MASADRQPPEEAPQHARTRPGGLKTLLDSNRVPTIATAPIRAHLHEQRLRESGDRRQDVLHPSEISKDGWCPRAAYYKLVSPAEREAVSFRQQLTFENGHSAHSRYQKWLSKAGKLEGFWQCQHCHHDFYDAGVPVCPICANWQCEYRELPIASPAHSIDGRTDGLLFEDNAVLEIKTVGLGTVRMASPMLVRANTHTFAGRQVVDYERVWDGIRRPFNAHVRQASIYAYCLRLDKKHRNIDKLVFLYEWKATSDLKEFVVKYSEATIAAILAKAQEVTAAVQGTGPIPECRDGENVCPECLKLAMAG